MSKRMSADRAVTSCTGRTRWAYSSRSQVAAHATSTAARVACGRLYVGVRRRPTVGRGDCTHFVTQSSCDRGRLLACRRVSLLLDVRLYQAFHDARTDNVT